MRLFPEKEHILNNNIVFSDKERLESISSYSSWQKIIFAMQKFQKDPNQIELLIRGLMLEKLGYFASNGYPRVSKGTIINNDGLITLGKGVKLEGCQIAVPTGSELCIGDYVSIGSETKVNVGNRIIIGDRTLVAWNVEIIGDSFHTLIDSNGNESERVRSVSIGSDVWIQTRAMILPGAAIGEGSVVAAGSILPGKEYPAHSLIAGNPAKPIKSNISWRR